MSSQIKFPQNKENSSLSFKRIKISDSFISGSLDGTNLYIIENDYNSDIIFVIISLNGILKHFSII